MAFIGCCCVSTMMLAQAQAEVEQLKVQLESSRGAEQRFNELHVRLC